MKTIAAAVLTLAGTAGLAAGAAERIGREALVELPQTALWSREVNARPGDGEVVRLSVVRWFAGGDATTVELVAPDGMEALIGGIDFVEGERYLVTATDGVVNYCGFTGLATPELTAIFERAFGA